MKKKFIDRLTISGARRFSRHVIAKPFMNMFVYKYVPRFFLLARFGRLKDRNSQDYWSDIHNFENIQHNSRFDNNILSILDRVDFKNKDVLDVGCGRGSFLKQLKNTKTRTGLDISQKAIELIKKDGIKGFVRKLPELDLHEKYDIITCFEVLEHTKFWKKTIKNAISCLVDGGLLIISVPFENGIVIDEHIIYFDLDRLYSFLKKKVTVLEIKIIGPWILVISQKKKYNRSDIYDYYPEI